MNDKILFEAWIETGRTNGLYTLHRRVIGRPTHEMVREYTYVRNLGRTWAVACENADKYCDGNPNVEYVKEYDITDECGTLRKAGTYDDNRFWFGKYEGNDIADIVANDVEYIKFLRDNFDRGTGNPRMTSLLKKFDDMDLGKSANEIREEEFKAKRAATDALMTAIPEELNDVRSTFRGEVVCVKEDYNDYGIVYKMLVIDERNFKIWSTRPRTEDGIERGDTVEFDGKLKISDRDEKFGFISRPTKATVIQKAA